MENKLHTRKQVHPKREEPQDDIEAEGPNGWMGAFHERAQKKVEVEEKATLTIKISNAVLSREAHDGTSTYAAITFNGRQIRTKSINSMSCFVEWNETFDINVRN